MLPGLSRCAQRTRICALCSQCLLQVFQVAFIIIRSINMDIFFIDWEKSSTPLKGPSDIPDVSTWRSLFATNEWNELLSYRRCSLEFTLILIMWLFNGQNWIYVATSRPNQFDLSVGALSVPLQFFFVLLLFFASSVCQYLVRVFVLERFIKCVIAKLIVNARTHIYKILQLSNA